MATNKKPKTMLILALVSLLLGMSGCTVGVIGVVKIGSWASDVGRSFEQTPNGGTAVLQASRSGTALIFTDSSSRSSATCTVEGPDGAVKLDNGGLTIGNSDTAGYSGYGTFDTKEGGSYEVSCDDSFNSSGSFFVAQLPSLPGGLGGLVAGIFGGGFFLFLALVFFIIALVQRSSWKKKQNAPMMAPAYGQAYPQPGMAPAPPGYPQQGYPQQGYPQQAAPPPPVGYAPPPAMQPPPAPPAPPAPDPYSAPAPVYTPPPTPEYTAPPEYAAPAPEYTPPPADPYAAPAPEYTPPPAPEYQAPPDAGATPPPPPPPPPV